MTPERLEYLTGHFKAGTCSAEELAELDKWYRFLDKDAAGFEADDLSGPQAEVLRASILNGIHAGIETGKDEEEQLPPASGRLWWRAAAAVFAGLALAAGFLYLNRTVEVRDGTVAVVTNQNENLHLNLPDGSAIWVKAGSEVRYKEDFGDGAAREVYLEGEAFFDIARNELLPFVVHTGELNIKVLGTSFNVRSYAGDEVVETTLIKGSVEIERVGDKSAAEPVILTPNQKVVYSRSDKTVLVSEAGHSAITHRKEADAKHVRMSFEERPFTEVLAQIEEKFEIRIMMENRDQQHCLFTADLEKESLPEIMEILELAHGLDCSLFRNELFIRGSVCSK